MADVDHQQTNGSEEKPTVSIGAVVGSPCFDRDLVSAASKLGTVNFRFLCYYIGGQRATWTPVAGQDPPEISVPDMQMNADSWSRYFCGQMSPWIDLDAEDEALAAVSERALLQELDYAKYLNLKAIMITLKHRDSPRLAALLAKRMWTTNVYYRIWVVVPTEEAALGERRDGDDRDLWGVWADFRRAVANHRLIGACVKLSADLDDEFVEPKRYRRWLAEPVAAVWLDADLFMQDARNKLLLPPAHSALVRALFAPTPSAQPIISCSSAASFDADVLGLYVPPVARLFAERVGVDSDEQSNSVISGFDDALQVPLQPLSDNLDSHTYEIFEKDPIKYVQYQKAIELAADKLLSDGVAATELVVMVLGAGRGPLVSAAIKAEAAVQRRRRDSAISFRLFAVEKNENAIVTLKFMNDTHWRKRVQVVCSDMRSFRPDVQADIVVSELLGSTRGASAQQHGSAVMGFAGYFDSVLFDDVTLSILPATHSPGLISWFPALFPLRDPVRLKKDDQLNVDISRRLDDGGVWYEWRAQYESPDGPVTTELQNPEGQSYYMRLQ
uniref:Protein arginine N-methyltransferase n=1 Tax=Plectus sambesii TaxID=2011161 RepID=A0A914V938_9BILA